LQQKLQVWQEQILLALKQLNKSPQLFVVGAASFCVKATKARFNRVSSGGNSGIDSESESNL
jgi:hypothetical protein